LKNTLKLAAERYCEGVKLEKHTQKLAAKLYCEGVKLEKFSKPRT
jgi:hypothetical protein